MGRGVRLREEGGRKGSEVEGDGKGNEVEREVGRE